MGEAKGPATESSLEPSADAVKERTSARAPQRARAGFGRYFEGWELGSIVLGLVAAAAWLAVPRSAAPDVFPVPLVDVAEERATRARYAELADQAEREGLPFETRAVGDALRRLGLVLAGGSGDVEHSSRVLAERIELALSAKQQSALLRLRAVQARMFARAVHAHVAGSDPSQELQALGGDFVRRATSNGWLGAHGFLGSEDELRALFVMRWSQLTRLRDDPALRPSLAELRRYYRFLLLYPEQTPGQDAPALERAQLRLRYAAALARHDRDYPLSLARGCLFGQIGSGAESAQAFSGYLAGSNAGEWKLRARNHLLHAAQGHGEDL
jgi:hypothetical protein